MPGSASGLDLNAFERLLTDISARFVNATPASVDDQITGALQALVEHSRRPGAASFLVEG